MHEKFETWLATEHGQVVAREAARRALILKAKGIRRYGIGAIAESIRFDHAVRIGERSDQYKVNNNYRSLLARRLMEKYPALNGFFETRELRSN